MTPSPPRFATDKSGFLLTETLATFTISAFVLLGLVSASSVLLRAVDRSIAHVQSVDDLSRTLDAIARDVSSLARARFDGVEPQPYIFRGGPNSLFFTHREIGRDGLPEMHVISLREIIVGTGTRLMGADAILAARTPSFDALRYGSAREFATGASRLRFSYVAPLRSDGTQPPHQKSWPSGRTLPVAIIVEVADAASGQAVLTLRIPIRANADIGCLDRDAPAGEEASVLAAPSAPQALPGFAPSTAAAPSAETLQPEDGSCSIRAAAARNILQ